MADARFQGQNKATTTFRLPVRAPGFTDLDSSISVSEGKPTPNFEAVIYAGNEGSEDAIGAAEYASLTDIWNVTADIGRGTDERSGSTRSARTGRRSVT